MVSRLAVYGTLKRGQRAHDLIELSVKYIEDVSIWGYMFSLGSYPGVRLDTVGLFKAELYEIKEPIESLLTRLDLYEGCPDLYTRKIIPVNGEPTYIYEYNGAAVGPAITEW